MSGVKVRAGAVGAVLALVAIGSAGCSIVDNLGPGPTALGGVSASTPAQKSLSIEVPPDSMDTTGFDKIVADPLQVGNSSTTAPVAEGQYVSATAHCDPAGTRITLSVSEQVDGKQRQLLSKTAACADTLDLLVRSKTKTAGREIVIDVVAPADASYRLYIGTSPTLDQED